MIKLQKLTGVASFVYTSRTVRTELNRGNWPVTFEQYCSMSKNGPYFHAGKVEN